MNTPEPVGVGLAEALALTLCREACMNYSPDDVRGCTDCWTVAKVLAETVATQQAPTVALDVETVARIHFDASARLAAREVGLNEPVAWTDLSDADRQHLRDSAAAIVAADPRRTEAEVKAEARKRIALAIADSVPYNCELRHDGTEDPIAAAYVQALGDAIRITEGATDE